MVITELRKNKIGLGLATLSALITSYIMPMTREAKAAEPYSNIVEVLPGDCDNNKRIDIADAILALQVSSGKNVSVSKGADVNADGRIGLPEAMYILQRQAGLREPGFTYISVPNPSPVMPITGSITDYVNISNSTNAPLVLEMAQGTNQKNNYELPQRGFYSNVNLNIYDGSQKSTATLSPTVVAATSDPNHKFTNLVTNPDNISGNLSVLSQENLLDKLQLNSEMLSTKTELENFFRKYPSNQSDIYYSAERQELVIPEGNNGQFVGIPMGTIIYQILKVPISLENIFNP